MLKKACTFFVASQCLARQELLSSGVLDSVVTFGWFGLLGLVSLLNWYVLLLCCFGGCLGRFFF